MAGTEWLMIRIHVLERKVKNATTACTQDFIHGILHRNQMRQHFMCAVPTGCTVNDQCSATLLYHFLSCHA